MLGAAVLDDEPLSLDELLVVLVLLVLLAVLELELPPRLSVL